MIALFKGIWNIAGTHGKNSLQIELSKRVHTIRDALPTKFRKCFVDWHQCECWSVAVTIMPTICTQIAGQDGDKIWGLIFPTAKFPRLLIHADSATLLWR